jgi:hypothetical protein
VLSRLRRWLPIASAVALISSTSIAVAPAVSATTHQSPIRTAAVTPSANIPPSPAYPMICQSNPASQACQDSAIAALNHARAVLGQPAYSLPAGFQQLPVPSQLLTLVNSDRAVAGLSQVRGLNATLNAAAQSAIATDGDPVGPSTVDGVRFTAWTSNWAAGWSSALYTYYEWMYDDGIGSSNIECTSSNYTGCWGHRTGTLRDFGSAFVAMGVGLGTSPNLGKPAFTELLEGFGSPVSLATTAASVTRGVRPGSVRQVVGSGRGDIVGRRPDGTLWLYRNTGALATTGLPYSGGNQVGSGWQGMTNIQAADVNCDGFSDLVATTADGTLWYYPNGIATNGSAPYAGGQVIGSGFAPFTHVVLADISGDGCADLLAVKSDGTLWYYPNNMNSNPGHVPFTSGLQVGSGWNYFSRISIADVTGDGYADIVATTPGGDLYMYTNGTATNPGRLPYSFGSKIGSGWAGMTNVTLSDVSGDGYADLVATSSDGTLMYYPNNSNSNPGHLPYATASRIGAGWQAYNQLA